MEFPKDVAQYSKLIEALAAGDDPVFLGELEGEDIYLIWADDRISEALGVENGKRQAAIDICLEPMRLEPIRQAVRQHRSANVNMMLKRPGSRKQPVELQVIPLDGRYFIGVIHELSQEQQLVQVFRSLDRVKSALDDNADVFYKAVLNAAIDAVPGTEAGSLWILEKDRFVCHAQSGFTNQLIGHSISYEDELAWYGLGETSFVMGIPRVIGPNEIKQRDADNVLPLLDSDEPMLSNLLIPIVYRGQVLGTFNLDNLHEAGAITHDSIIAGQVFVREIVAYMESRRREYGLQNRLKLLDRIAEVSRIARTANSQGQLFMKILATLREYTPTEEAAIALLSENGDSLHVVASTSPDLTAGARVPRGRGASWRAIEEKRVIFIPNALEDPRVVHYGDEARLKGDVVSVISAPLTGVGGKVVGVLTINSRTGRRYQDEEIAFIEAVAEALGMSIERLQALGEATRRAEAYRKLLGLSSEIEAIDSPREIAQRALHTILELTPFEAAAFYTVDPVDGGKIKPEVIAGDYPSQFPRAYFDNAVKLGDGLVGTAIVNRSSRAVYDYGEYPGAITVFREMQIRSVLVEPLWVKDTPYGALALLTFTSPTIPSSEARNLLQLIARRIERAIERIGHLTSLREARDSMLRAFGVALERRDYETQGHTERVTQLSVELASALGFRGQELEAIRWGAYLHDIGKLSIPDRILLKPGPLTDEEWELMKRHTEIGYDMLEPIPFLPDASRNIVRYHHERWDGKGYPQGLANTDIPIEARIFAVADVFDALAHDRPYKKGWPLEAAYAELKKLAGEHLDPVIVDRFLQLHAKKTAR
ncbi:HD domain-containing phosphohydrolase [Oceanithermus sp.]